MQTTAAKFVYRDSRLEREWLKRFCAQEAMPFDETLRRLLSGGPLKLPLAPDAARPRDVDGPGRGWTTGTGEMQKFAAYDDSSIYAVGDTAEGAIAKALNESGTPTAIFAVAQISDGLAAWIEENGWNGMTRSFEVRDGQIYDTTA